MFLRPLWAYHELDWELDCAYSHLSQLTVSELVASNSKEGFRDGKARGWEAESGSRPILRANQNLVLCQLANIKTHPTMTTLPPKPLRCRPIFKD